MSRTPPGRPKAGEWRRSIGTATPTLTYGYYIDVEIVCRQAQYSPPTKFDEVTQVHRGTQTIYLGAYEHRYFITHQVAIIGKKLDEWQDDHPVCRIVNVGSPYRHKRGS